MSLSSTLQGNAVIPRHLHPLSFLVYSLIDDRSTTTFNILGEERLLPGSELLMTDLNAMA